MPVLVHAFIIVVLLVLMALLQNVLRAGAQFVYVSVCFMVCHYTTDYQTAVQHSQLSV